VNVSLKFVSETWKVQVLPSEQFLVPEDD
jgi:hypothetical protein